MLLQNNNNNQLNNMLPRRYVYVLHRIVTSHVTSLSCMVHLVSVIVVGFQGPRSDKIVAVTLCFVTKTLLIFQVFFSTAWSISCSWYSCNSAPTERGVAVPDQDMVVKDDSRVTLCLHDKHACCPLWNTHWIQDQGLRWFPVGTWLTARLLFPLSIRGACVVCALWTRMYVHVCTTYSFLHKMKQKRIREDGEVRTIQSAAWTRFCAVTFQLSHFLLKYTFYFYCLL